MTGGPDGLIERIFGSWGSRLDADAHETRVLVAVGTGVDAERAALVRPHMERAVVSLARLAKDPPRRNPRERTRQGDLEVGLEPDRWGPAATVRLAGPMVIGRQSSRTDRIEHRDEHGEAIVTLGWSDFSTDDQTSRFGFARDLADFAARTMLAVEEGVPLLPVSVAEGAVERACTDMRGRMAPGAMTIPRLELALATPWSSAAAHAPIVGMGDLARRMPITENCAVVLSILTHADGNGPPRLGVELTTVNGASDQRLDEPRDAMAALRAAADDAAFASATRIAWFDR